MLMACLLFALPAAAQSDMAHQQFLFAYKLLQRGDDALAAEEFDKYLGDYPQDVKVGDARYYRALLHRRAGEYREAVALLQELPAPELVPAHAVELLRGQTFVDLKQYEAALLSLEKIQVSELETELAVSVYYLRGLAYRGANNLPAAAQQFEAAAAGETSMQGRALLDLARVQVLQDRPAEAVQLLGRVLEVGNVNEQAEAARLAGDLSYQQGEHEQAVRFYQRIVTNHQTTRHFGPAVTGTLWSQFAAGQHRAVLDTFRQHRSALPARDRTAAQYLAASAHQELGDHEQAVALFEQIAQGAGETDLYEKILYKLAVSQYELARHDAMRQTLADLDRRFPQSPHRVDGTYLLAAADAQQGNVAGGAARLTQLIHQGPGSAYYTAALLRRARLYHQHDKLDAAVADYQRYLQAMRDSDDAPRSASTVQQVTHQLLELLQQLGWFEQLKQTAQALLDEASLDPQTEQTALYRLAMAQIRLGEIEPALGTLVRLDERHPLHAYEADATYYRGLLLLNLGRADEAALLLEKASRHEGLAAQRRASVLRLLAIQHRDAGRDDAAREALSRLQAQVGQSQLNDAELIWLSRDALAAGDAARAVTYLQPVAAGERAGSTVEQRAEAYYLLGEAQRELGSLDAAAEAFARVVTMGRGFDLEAQLAWAQTLVAQGKPDEALQKYQLLLRSGATRFEAEALFDSANVYRKLAADAHRREQPQRRAESLHEARRLLKRLVLLYSFEQLEPLPQLAHLDLAEIARDLGEADDALAEWQALIDKYEQDACALYARAAMAAQAGQVDQAKSLLSRLSEQTLDPRLAERAAALRTAVEAGP